MIALLLSYSFTALCTYKGEISASAIYLWRFFVVNYLVGLHRNLVASMAFPIAFIPLFFLLQHALSQLLEYSGLWAQPYSPLSFDISLGLFRLQLLWIGTTSTS